jgi:tetratricopeptide (TPR) repeat protein
MVTILIKAFKVLAIIYIALIALSNVVWATSSNNFTVRSLTISIANETWTYSDLPSDKHIDIELETESAEVAISMTVLTQINNQFLIYYKLDKPVVTVTGAFIISQSSNIATIKATSERLILQLYGTLNMNQEQTLLFILDKYYNPLLTITTSVKKTQLPSPTPDVGSLISMLEQSLESSPLGQTRKNSYVIAILQTQLLLAQGNDTGAYETIMAAINDLDEEIKAYQEAYSAIQSADIILKGNWDSLPKERREQASALIAKAKNELTVGDYTSAISDAQKAQELATLTFIDQILPHLPIIGVIVVIFIGALIVKKALRARSIAKPSKKLTTPGREEMP